MTDQQPAQSGAHHYQSTPPQPGQVYGQHPDQPWPTMPPRKRKAPTWLIITAAVALGVCGIGTIAAIAGGGTDLDTPPAPGQREAPAEPAEPAADEPDPPEQTFPEPDPDDFDLTAKILSKECFGSAGCLIDFRIELAYDGPELDPAVTYELIYEVAGGESDYVNTLTISGDQYSTEETESISTPSDRELTVTVTDVSEF